MTPMRIIDYNFIQHILNENQASFDQVLAEYYDSIYYHILKIVHNEEEARDLTNDTFGKVYINLNMFKPNYKFRSWLYRIATNTAIDSLRKRKLLIDTTKEIDENTQVIDDSSADTELNKKENYATLKDAVSRLKPHYRMIIHMRYYGELSYEEIAKRLHCSIGKVKADLHRAKVMLNQIITNQKI
jgi:RNA polymerase sigma-70 factor (ECF subfamily)